MKKPIKLSLADLKTKFKQHRVTSCFQCAGNRRDEMNPLKKVKGLEWGFTAISNAEWTGVLLKDVLKYAGIDTDKEGVEHIQFEGMDLDPSGKPYGASIPIETVRQSDNEIIIAYEMNGQPLPLDHGYPLRIIVPGVVGARQVKWLNRIIVSDSESDSHWQQNDYKMFSPNVDWNTVDFKTSLAIHEAPVVSAICEPLHGAKIEAGSSSIELRGYAWSGGGRGIVRVDVSADDGKTWTTAKLERAPNQKINRMWAWTLWTADIPLDPKFQGKVTLICKAVDASYNNQPDTVAPIWNLRGCLNNSWHRVDVKVEN